MRALLSIIMAAALALNLSACGFKGKLKSPSQIAKEEAKKQKKADGEEDNTASPSSPASPESPEMPASPASPASPAGAE